MKVSVIIPNYNHASFLKQRIDSVINQSIEVKEVILLDDCSTDDSLEIINQYKTHPLVKHIVVNTRNSGSPFLQWQKGIDLASGEWIWIAESDDFAHRDFLKEMSMLASEYPNAGFLYCDSNILDVNDAIGGSFALAKSKRINTHRWDEIHTNSGKDELLQFMLVYGTVNNTSAAIFNASILKSIAVTTPLLRYTGDKLVFCKILLKTDIAYSPSKYNYYRAGSGKPKHTNDYFEYAFEHFLILASVFNEVPQLEKTIIKKVIVENIQINFLSQMPSRISRYMKMLFLSPKIFLSILSINLYRKLKKR